LHISNLRHHHRIAAVQAEPAWLDLEGGVVKIISLIKEAAANGAGLVGFPEVFLPGYPMKIWSEGFDSAFLLKYQKASMSVRSNEYMRIRQAAREAGIW
jgi:predicted amidohydrolase